MSRHAPEPWQSRALCAETDAESFFPHESTPRHHREAAKAICAVCPVAGPCLDEALSTHDQWGIRGGLTPKERRPLLRARAS